MINFSLVKVLPSKQAVGYGALSVSRWPIDHFSCWDSKPKDFASGSLGSFKLCCGLEVWKSASVGKRGILNGGGS